MQKISFSSDQLPAHLSDKKRFDLWCDLHRVHVSPMDYRASDGPFRARLEFAQFGAAALGHMTGSLTYAAHGKAEAS